MKRRHDWRSRLSDRINDLSRQSFQWGVVDGAVFAASLVEAMTDEDFFAPFRGTYSNEIGAVRALKAAGADDLESYIATLFEECPPAMAHVGDLAVVPGDPGHCIGIILGERIATMAKGGYGTVDRALALRTFRIG